MIKNKKGLSAIVTTLLVILLVLVAVGIVWGVVRNLVAGGAKDLEISSKCLNIDVRANSVKCPTSDACVVNFERTGTDSSEIAGVKLVFADSVNAKRSESAIEVTGNIAQLVGKSATVDSNVTAPDSVEVTVFFEDESANEKLCPQTTKFTF